MATNAVATRRSTEAANQDEDGNPLVQLRDQLTQRSAEFKMALPAHISPAKFQRTILTAVQSNPQLLQCNRRSFITSCMKAAQDGLLPDGREAALVMFKTRQKIDGQWREVKLVQYMPMVFGLRKKILQSGAVKDIFANVVYRQEVEAGLFIYEEGTERMLRHKPLLDPSFEPVDEDICAAYSVATLSDGTMVFEVMRRSEINKVRQMSQTGADKRKPIEPKGPWVDWFSEMAKKTVIRRHSKTLPMSGDIIDVEAFDEALAARSAAAALSSGEPDSPALSAPRREEEIDGVALDMTPSDENSDQTEDEPQAEQPKATRTRRQAKPEPEPEEQHDPQTGEIASQDDADATDDAGDDSQAVRRAADAIIAEAEAVPNIMDLNSLRSRVRRDVSAMPEEIAAEVESAFAAAEQRVKAAK